MRGCVHSPCCVRACTHAPALASVCTARACTVQAQASDSLRRAKTLLALEANEHESADAGIAETEGGPGLKGGPAGRLAELHVRIDRLLGLQAPSPPQVT